MTLRHLQIFVEVALTGKMSTAASHLYISQPTVSQAIRELEEHYHVLLFERLSKRLYITEEGKTLLSFASRTLEQYRMLEEAMGAVARRQTIRIGATLTIGTCMLSGIVNELKRAFDGLNTYTYTANTENIEKKLLNSELDIAIVEGTITSPDLICRPIAEDYLVLAMSPGHPLAAQSQISFRQLENMDFALREEGSGTRKLFTDVMNRKNIPINIVCEAGCAEALKHAILDNDCLTAVSVRLLVNEIESGAIRCFTSQNGHWNRFFYLVYHKDKLLTAPMEALKQLLPAYAQTSLPKAAMGIVTD